MLCRKALAWADTTYLNRLHPEEDLVLVGAALYCVLYGVGWKQLTLMRYWWANLPDWVFTCALATFSCSTSEELPNLGGGLSDSPTAIHCGTLLILVEDALRYLGTLSRGKSKFSTKVKPCQGSRTLASTKSFVAQAFPRTERRWKSSMSPMESLGQQIK